MFVDDWPHAVAVPPRYVVVGSDAQKPFCKTASARCGCIQSNAGWGGVRIGNHSAGQDVRELAFLANFQLRLRARLEKEVRESFEAWRVFPTISFKSRALLSRHRLA